MSLKAHQMFPYIGTMNALSSVNRCAGIRQPPLVPSYILPLGPRCSTCSNTRARSGCVVILNCISKLDEFQRWQHIGIVDRCAMCPFAWLLINQHTHDLQLKKHRLITKFKVDTYFKRDCLKQWNLMALDTRAAHRQWCDSLHTAVVLELDAAPLAGLDQLVADLARGVACREVLVCFFF